MHKLPNDTSIKMFPTNEARFFSTPGKSNFVTIIYHTVIQYYFKKNSLGHDSGASLNKENNPLPESNPLIEIHQIMSI